MFLFHNIIVITKEVKPNEKYKVLITIKIRQSLKISKEEGEEATSNFIVMYIVYFFVNYCYFFVGEFSIDTGKRKFIFTAKDHDESSEWVTTLSQCLDGEHDPDHIKPVFDDVDGKKVWNVRASISDEHLEKLKEMHSIVSDMELDERTKNWCDDACLCRFLRYSSSSLKFVIFPLMNYYSFI